MLIDVSLIEHAFSDSNESLQKHELIINHVFTFDNIYSDNNIEKL